MTGAVLGTLDGSRVSNEDIDRLRRFIREDEHSDLALVMRAILNAAEDGVNINVFADDVEVSPNEAAKLMKMSRPHLLKFMRDGDLPFHMVGTHQRIKMSDLRRFMKSREQGAELLATALNAHPQSTAHQFTQGELDELDNL